MLGQLYWDGGTHRGAEHPLQHLDNLVSDLNKSFFPHQKSYHSTTYFFRRRELWIWFVDPFIVRDHRPGAYDECADTKYVFLLFPTWRSNNRRRVPRWRRGRPPPEQTSTARWREGPPTMSWAQRNILLQCYLWIFYLISQSMLTQTA